MPKNTPLDDWLLTASEAAELLGTSRPVLDQWRFRDQGPEWVLINKRSVRYRYSSLMAYVADRTVTPSDPGPMKRAVNE